MLHNRTAPGVRPPRPLIGPRFTLPASQVPAATLDRRGRSFRSLRTFALGMLFGSVALAAAPAADPSAAPPAISDIVLARSALTALDADRQLRDVNLLVSVVDRVAVIGGPVASAEMSKRAEAIVRNVPGIVEVKNRCFVREGSDPLLRAMSARWPESPRRVLASELPGIVASPKTGLVEEYAPALGENNLAAVVPTEKSVVALRPMNPSASVLLPPVGSAIPVPMAPSGTAPAILMSRPADVLSAADAVLKDERRFAGLKLNFANGTLVIAGTASRASDAWDLAQNLRRIPGVSRVVIGVVDVK